MSWYQVIVLVAGMFAVAEYLALRLDKIIENLNIIYKDMPQSE